MDRDFRLGMRIKEFKMQKFFPKGDNNVKIKAIKKNEKIIMMRRPMATQPLLHVHRAANTRS